MRRIHFFAVALLCASSMSLSQPQMANAQTSSYFAQIEAAQGAMMRDPSAALQAAQQAAQSLADETLDGDLAELLARAEWLQAEALTRLGRPGDAAPIADAALARLGANPAPTKLFADLNVARGRIAVALGDFETGFVSFTAAYEVFQTLDEARSQAIVLQSIGSIYTAAHQYERALAYFDDAMERYSDPSLDLAGLNNRANALRELGRYDEALNAYERSLEAAAGLGSPMLEARILNNIAALHVSFGDFDAAEAALAEADARVEGMGSGEWSRFLDGVRGQIALGRGEPALASTYLERTFDGVPFDSSPQNFAEFHEAAVRAYAGLGQYRAALDHLFAFKRLDDEARNVAASANSALLGAEFEFAEQDLQIEQLRAERLEQDLLLASERARGNTMALLAVIALIIAVLIAGLVRYRTEAARKRALAKILYFDAETGLLSRAGLVERIRRSDLKAAQAAIMTFEIESFTQFQSAFGFAAAIELKTQLAERLSRSNGVHFVALVGPGLLSICFAIPGAKQQAASVLPQYALGLKQQLQKPVKIHGTEVEIVAGCGIGQISLDETDREIIENSIKNSILAITQSDNTKSTPAIFNEFISSDFNENIMIISEFRNATINGHVKMHYQGKMDLHSRKITSAEALMRWNDPEMGYVSPDRYIPVLERAGKIRHFTQWSIESVIADQDRFSDAGHPTPVAVNVSACLLGDKAFSEYALQAARLSCSGLIFEITETGMMEDIQSSMETLSAWKRAGIKISIDDYGSGQSSLAYIKNIPASELKLDRFFVDCISTSERDRHMIKSTVDLAHSLGMTLTAEGVEDDETTEILRGIGCDTVQGFGVHRPASAADFIEFMKQSDAKDKSNVICI